MADRPVGMGGDSPESSMGMSSGPCTLADSSPMSMSIFPSCDMASYDERVLNSGDCPTDALVRRNGRQKTIPHPQHNEILRPGASMAMPPFDSSTPTSNPQTCFPRTSSPTWRCLGCCLDKAAPLALSPAPNRRCLRLRNQFVGAGLPWPRPGPLARVSGVSLWKRVVSRADGVSRALSGPWVVATLCAVPSELRAPRLRRQGGRISRTIEYYNDATARRSYMGGTQSFKSSDVH